MLMMRGWNCQMLIDEECMTGAQHISGEQVQCAG